MDEEALNGFAEGFDGASANEPAAEPTGDVGGEEASTPAEDDNTESATTTETGSEQHTAQPADGDDDDDEIIPDPDDPAERTPRQQKGLKKAYLAEKRRRQESARQLAELQGRIAAYEQMAQQRQTPQAQQEPDAEVDPDGMFFETPSKAVAEAVNGGIGSLRTEMRQQIAAISRNAVRSAHDDYDEVEAVFLKEIQNDAGLRQAFLESQDPARFAYEQGKFLRKIENVGSLEDLEAKLRADIEAEYQRKLRAQTADQNAARTSITSASVNSANTGGSGSVESLDDMDLHSLVDAIRA